MKEIVTYSFENRHNTLLVTPQHTHHMFACGSVAAFNIADFHSISQHAR
jgi:hypothetical protein